MEDEKYAYVNFLRIVHGAVIQVHTVELEKKIEEDKEALLAFAIYEIRQLVNSNSKEIIVPFYPDVQLEGVQYLNEVTRNNYWICPKEMYPILDWIENGRGI